MPVGLQSKVDKSAVCRSPGPQTTADYMIRISDFFL